MKLTLHGTMKQNSKAKSFRGERPTRVLQQVGLDKQTSTNCKSKLQFGLDKQTSTKVHNFNNNFLI